MDLAAAAKHGVTVTNTPGVSAVSIAEHSLMLMLAVARRVVAIHNGVVAGQWLRGQSIQLNGKTLGDRAGAIGRQFARIAQGMECCDCLDDASQSCFGFRTRGA